MSTRVNGVKQTRPWSQRKPERPETPLDIDNFEERWQSLTPRGREFLSLRHVEGLTLEEVAERCFVERHTVKTTIWESHARLGIRAQGKQGTTLLPYLMGRYVERKLCRGELSSSD